MSTLLGPPLVQVPLWLTLLLCMGVAALAAALRGLWGFGLALGTLALAAPLWQLNVLFPGMSVSLSAILGTALVALERWWILRNLGVRDPLTGFGNRLAFTRALEGRWQGRRTRPLGLLLIDLSGFRKVNEAYGRPAGDELLRNLAARIGPHKRRGDLIFRWGPDEFAVLLDNTSAPNSGLAARMQRLARGLTCATSRCAPMSAGHHRPGHRHPQRPDRGRQPQRCRTSTSAEQQAAAEPRVPPFQPIDSAKIRSRSPALGVRGATLSRRCCFSAPSTSAGRSASS